MIGKLHPTSQANFGKLLEKFMFRFVSAETSRFPGEPPTRGTRKQEGPKDNRSLFSWFFSFLAFVFLFCLLTNLPALPASAKLPLAVKDRR